MELQGSLSNLVAWRDGLIATGCVSKGESQCSQRIVLMSGDGESWEQLNVAHVPGDLGAGSLHRVGGRLFVLGYADGPEFGGAFVLTSSDGRAWSRIKSASFQSRAVRDIIRSPLGTFGIGYNAPPGSDNTSGFLVWPVGADGAFGAVRALDPGGELAIVTGAGWIGDEFLAWGPRQHPMGGRGPMVVLASSDARQWAQRAVIAADGRAWVSDIVAARDRLVAVGYEGRRFPLTPRAWFSDDNGATWTPADVPGDDEIMVAVEVLDSGLVAQGFRGWDSTRQVVSWRSTDGSVWVRLREDEDLPLVPGFGGLAKATIGAQTCVAGNFYDDVSAGAAIYCR